MGKMIYLDNAATTKTAPEVVEAMLPYFTEYVWKSRPVYMILPEKAKHAVTKGREQIANVLGAKNRGNLLSQQAVPRLTTGH